MCIEENPEEAIYTLHFLSGQKPPARISGLKQLYCKNFDEKMYLSEWLIVRSNFGQIVSRLSSFDVRMRQFRVHKPDKEIWCVVDWKLLQKAIEHGFTIEV